jgi:hypothetical protein
MSLFCGERGVGVGWRKRRKVITKRRCRIRSGIMAMYNK